MPWTNRKSSKREVNRIFSLVAQRVCKLFADSPVSDFKGQLNRLSGYVLTRLVDADWDKKSKAEGEKERDWQL